MVHEEDDNTLPYKVSFKDGAFPDVDWFGADDIEEVSPLAQTSSAPTAAAPVPAASAPLPTAEAPALTTAAAVPTATTPASTAAAEQPPAEPAAPPPRLAGSEEEVEKFYESLWMMVLPVLGLDMDCTHLTREQAKDILGRSGISSGRLSKIVSTSRNIGVWELTQIGGQVAKEQALQSGLADAENLTFVPGLTGFSWDGSRMRRLAEDPY